MEPNNSLFKNINNNSNLLTQKNNNIENNNNEYSIKTTNNEHTNNENTNNENISLNKQEISLNTLIELVILAHKRGSLTLEESSKAWEAIKVFMPDIENK